MASELKEEHYDRDVDGSDDCAKNQQDKGYYNDPSLLQDIPATPDEK